jgi:ribosomal protein L16 Arg81 hydroxylase
MKVASQRIKKKRNGSSRLPAECRLWIAENRLSGISDKQIASILAESGYEPSAVALELEGLENDPSYLAAERMAHRFNKLKSILDVRRVLASLSYGSDSIERRTSVSQSEFLERYYAVNRPVILTGLLNGCPARERWSPEYLAEICGDVQVQIMAGRQSDPRYELNSESHKREVKMSEYVGMVRDGGPSNDYYLVANNSFFDLPETQALLSEVPQLPEYLDHSDSAGRVFLWFGPAGTITPLHHDMMNVMVAQITGRKRFTLIAPEQTPYVYNHIGVYSEVDCGKPDYSRHPLYGQTTPTTFVLEPGDVLFIPVGWWHYVEALYTSIIVSYINFGFPNNYDWSNPDIH